MSTVFFNQIPIDMTNPFNWGDFLNAIASSSHSSTSWSAANAATGGVWQFTGTGFSNYQSNVPFAGTITGITYTVNGVTLFSVTGASASVFTFLASGASGDWATAVAGLYPGNETVTGTSGADHLQGFAGNDTLSGGDGDDIFTFSSSVDSGVDSYDGGAGADFLYFQRTFATGVTINAAEMATNTGAVLADGTVLRNIEGISFVGGSGDDTLIIGPVGIAGSYFGGGGGTDTVVADLHAETGPVHLWGSYQSQPGGFWGYLFDNSIEQFHITTGSGDDNLASGNGADIFSTGAGADYVWGGGGNDIINGGDGGDSLDGGSGPSSLNTGDDIIHGDAGNDSIRGGDGVNQLYGDEGDDAIYASSADVIDGGAGTDSVSLDASSATSAVTASVTAASFTLTGLAVNLTNVELLFGLRTGQGDDAFSMSGIVAGLYNFDGGAGFDRFTGDFSLLTVDLRLNAGEVFSFDSALQVFLTGIDAVNLTGGSGNDMLSGTAGDDVLRGGGGNDRFFVSEGNDILEGGGGDDDFDGFGPGAIMVDGGAGTDRIRLDGSSLTTPLTFDFDLYAGAAGADLNGTTVRNFERFIATGGSADDTFNFVGLVGEHFLTGLAGNDRINLDLSAEPGNVSLLGSAGVVTGASGRVNFSGVEVVSLVCGGGDDRIDGSGAQLFVTGGAGSDQISASQFDMLDDILDGGAGYDGLSGGGGNDTLRGGADNDGLDGGEGDDLLDGGDGDDSIFPGAGNDTMLGGAGDDSFWVIDGASSDVIDGGAGVDRAMVSRDGATASYVIHVADLLSATGLILQDGTIIRNIETFSFGGGSGNDTFYIDSTSVNVGLSGGEGVDTAIANFSTSTEGMAISSGLIRNASNTFSAGVYVDRYDIVGSEFGDTFDGSSGDDIFRAGGGNDWLAGGAGADVLDGGAGIDMVSYGVSAAAVTVNLTTSSASGGHATGDTLSNFENVAGSSYNDTLIGSSGANVLTGEEGADTLTGGAGADSISGGFGDDIINYNFGDGVDASIDGGAGTDRIVTFGNAGGETLDVRWEVTEFTFWKGSTVKNVEQGVADMGGGVDWLRNHNSSVGVSVNLALGTATGFISIANIENAWGSAFADTLTGSAVANIIRGGAGDDQIDGGGDNDTLVGDDGIDTILGGAGADAIYGLSGADIINAGDDNDTIYYSFGEGVDAIDGGLGTDTIICQGNSGAETLEVIWNGASFTFFKGGAVASIEQASVDMGLGGDWLRYTGSSASITINLTTNTASGFTAIANIENAGGGSGADTITGSNAANNLIGNDGADQIDGAGGNDTLNGGAGADRLTGGADSDALTGGADADTFVFATGSGADSINDFDADAAGGQDFIDLSGYGITAIDFATRVTITDQGANTLITIDGVNTIILHGVTGDGANIVTQTDFILGP